MIEAFNNIQRQVFGEICIEIDQNCTYSRGLEGTMKNEVIWDDVGALLQLSVTEIACNDRLY